MKPREKGTSPRAKGTHPRRRQANPRAKGTNRRLTEQYGDALAAELHQGRRYRRAFARWKVQHGHAALCAACDDTGWINPGDGFVRCSDHVTLTPRQVSLLVDRFD